MTSAFIITRRFCHSFESKTRREAMKKPLKRQFPNNCGCINKWKTRKSHFWCWCTRAKTKSSDRLVNVQSSGFEFPKFELRCVNWGMHPNFYFTLVYIYLLFAHFWYKLLQTYYPFSEVFNSLEVDSSFWYIFVPKEPDRRYIRTTDSYYLQISEF